MKTVERLEFIVKFLTTLALVIYVGVLHYSFRALRPDHIFLVLLMLTLTFHRKRYVNLFLLDWLPFMLFLIFYDMMRGLAGSFYERVHILEPYQWEKMLFGWMAGGEAIPFAIEKWRLAHEGAWFIKAMTSFLSVFYMMHFILPMVFMWILWRSCRDRRMFYRFTYTLTVLNFMALATFALYPAAPPWYFSEYGNVIPTATFYEEAAGGLAMMDKGLRFQVFATVWATFNANYFAAIPSLHGAWPVVVVLFAILKFGRRYHSLWLYPFFVCLGGAFFMHHYYVDYIIGWIYIAIAYVFVHKVLMPHLFDRILDYEILK